MNRPIRSTAAAGVSALLLLAACSENPNATESTIGAASAVTLPPQASAQAEDVVPGEIIVGMVNDDELEAVAQDNALEVKGRGRGKAFGVLRVANGNERAMAARLKNDARVRFAEPNYLRQPTIDSRLWGFYNDGTRRMIFTSGTSTGQVVTSKPSANDADIDANGTAEVDASGGAAVVVGSIDTGVDFNHPEFAGGTLIAGWDWVSNDNDPSDQDDHGSHTTGTMAGLTVGVAGVTGANGGSQRNVKVYVQRVCGPTGCPTSAIVSAIRAAADYPGLVAMNLSLGGSSESQAEKDAIAYATSKNVLVIASAGNDGTNTVSCPACDPNAISVAAVNWAGALSYFSNRGSGLDVSAPGGEMYSNTSPEGGIYSSVRGGLYAYFQGTSMAAPMVTGVAGVVASVKGLRGAALRSALESNTDDLGTAGYDTQFGYGRVNLAKVLNGSGGGGGGGGGTTITASIAKSCNNSASCTFTATTNATSPSYAWTSNGAALGTGNPITKTFAAGNFTVGLTVSSVGGGATASTTISCKATGKVIRCS